ncbi:hypothetical protein DFH09DRAFT_1311701 [Mycena vulgaris]|nr:hypothetical protein DFH09DRAFT_1311701 [Mycena vulgaris]
MPFAAASTPPHYILHHIPLSQAPAAPARLRLFPAATLALTLLAALTVLTAPLFLAVMRAAVAARRRLALPLSGAKAIQVQENSSPKNKPQTGLLVAPAAPLMGDPPPAHGVLCVLACSPRRPRPPPGARPRNAPPRQGAPPTAALSPPLPRLGLLAARAPAGCEPERLSTAAAIASGSAPTFFPGRRTHAMRAAYSYAHSAPPHARKAPSHEWAVGVGVAALRDSSPMPQMNNVTKVPAPRMISCMPPALDYPCAPRLRTQHLRTPVMWLRRVIALAQLLYARPDQHRCLGAENFLLEAERMTLRLDGRTHV